MPHTDTLALLLPHAAPDHPNARILLTAIRRIAAGGTDDASAVNLMIGAYGIGYRRPLMFLRVLMQEISRVSQHSISIAPCCCPRMAEGEAAIMLAVDIGTAHPEVARAALSRVTGTLDLLPALSVAQALGTALEDLGRPVSL